MSIIPYKKSYTPVYASPFVDIDRLFDNFFGNAITNLSAKAPSVAGLALRLDVSETDRAYHVTADLPGVEEKDVSVTLDDGVLTVSGAKEQEKEEDGKTFHRVERGYGSFARSLALPADADENAIHARMKNGVLEIEIGKSRAAPKTAKKIEIQSK